MFTDYFFHPDHVIPMSKLIAAFTESSNLPISKMAVELGAVSVKVVIFFLRIADAGVQIQNSHGFQPALQFFVFLSLP